MKLNNVKDVQTFIAAVNACEHDVYLKSVEGDVSPMCQASILRTHPNVVFLLDENAASLLTK